MTNHGHGPTGLPRDHPESYHSFMWNNFFKHIDIHPENTHILDGNAADLQAECDAFEEKIKAAGGIELFVGGELDTAVGVQATPSMARTHVCLQTASSLCAGDSGGHLFLGGGREGQEWEPSSPPWVCYPAALILDISSFCTSMPYL